MTNDHKSFCLVDFSDDPDTEDFCTCTQFMSKKAWLNEKYKRRYVLAEGWILPNYRKGIGILIGMQDEHGKCVHINPPDIDSGDKECPKYKLVLERC